MIPSAIATTETSASTKVAAPAMGLSPTSWVKPIRPKAPGTSSQKAGRKLTSAGGAEGKRSIRTASGATNIPPTKPLRRAPSSVAPMS